MPSTLAILGGQPLRTRPFPTWPVFDAREREQLDDVLNSSNWGGFPSPNRKAAEFAAAFAAYQGARFAIPTTSGTSALEVALKALGIGAGDEVIVPALTFAATPYAAVACMARPIFADVSAANACIDPDSVTRLITRRTKAIIPVHYGASLADLDALAEISRAHSIPLVEDCAHVPGARWRERGVGTHGALGCFSFQSTKPMTAGEGGMITTDDPDLEQRCQSLINCGRRRPGDTFEGPLMGANYRMTEWQCGILLAQLARLPEQIERKSRAAARLREGLGAIRGISPIARDPRVTREVIYAFVFLVYESALGLSRNRFVRAMRAEGIPCGVGNDPVYRSALFPRESAAYRKACELAGASNLERTSIDCPVAERLFEYAMAAIPHECLLGDDRDVDDIVAAAAKVASRAAELAAANLDKSS
ncbi:DegT/DnrJ/EryC1/StrS family aminotransferase [Candidatus Binatus soli]|jgi:dTDP-4-amino-4,6-dideoxygalactose transaminase|uniref:DegT/DnrJ/EryC1/StrS family aminotransferase n=1 Tax=Candidatus Binatus soli TaxID=1953413 RepID=UPI003D0A6802